MATDGGRHDQRALRESIWLVEQATRRLWTQMAVKSGHACPEIDCGRTYRHQHADVWWPPEPVSQPGGDQL